MSDSVLQKSNLNHSSSSSSSFFFLCGLRLDLEKFMLWPLIICFSIFRHLSCLRRWQTTTESNIWVSCKSGRRVDVFPLQFKSWRSLLSLPRGQKKRVQRRRRHRALHQVEGKFQLRRPSTLSLTAAAVLQAMYLRETRQLLQARTLRSE